MIRNLDKNNLESFVYDLTPEEHKFYRGSGNAMIVLNLANHIIACLYDPDRMPPREGEEAALNAAMKQGTKWMKGVMSSYQFCRIEEGRLNIEL